MMQGPNHYPNADQEHLRLLALFSRIYGGLAMAVSLCFTPHLFIGFAMLLGSNHVSGMWFPIPAAGGIVVVIVAILAMLTFIGIGVLNFMAAKWMEQRRNFMGVCIVAAINCLNVPLGTILGVFTLVVVNRDSVRLTFDQPATP